MWARPAGVAPGTWQYVHQRSIADRYDDFVAGTALCNVDEQVLRRILPPTQTSPRPIVLDLGCGTGRSAIPLATRGYAVVGVDLSQPMLRVLTEKAAASNLDDHVHAVRANLVELGCIAHGVADHAVCMFATLGMIQGRSNRRSVLYHVGRIVRPGGTFVLHVHHRWAALRERHGLSHLAASWWRSVRNRGDEFGDSTYGYRGLADMFMHRFSRRELIADLSHGGWTATETLRLSIDGSRVLTSGQKEIAGGFIIVATNRS